jgi:hypothetical protein
VRLVAIALLISWHAAAAEPIAEPEQACGDLGPAAPGSETPLPASIVDTSVYPYRIAFVPKDELARRTAVLEQRNPGFHVQLTASGRLFTAVGAIMPCSTLHGLAHRGLNARPSEDEREFVQAFLERNRDVIAPEVTVDDVSIGFHFSETIKPAIELTITGHYWPAVRALRFRELDDKALWSRIPARARVVRETCVHCVELFAVVPTAAVASLHRRTVVCEGTNQFEVRRVVDVWPHRVPAKTDRELFEVVLGYPQALDAVLGDGISDAGCDDVGP